MHERSRGLGFGLIGGAIGLVAMDLVRRGTAPLVNRRAPERTTVFLTERTMSPLGPQHRNDEGATDALGRITYQRITGKEPAKATKRKLSWAVHIAYGLLVAAGYGVIRGRSRHVVRDGLLFGAGLWLLGDELAVPLLGLADKPTAYHPSRHAQALVEHLAYGVAAATTARALGGVR